MKAIIPLAGKGTRLRPHTYATPKPLLKVAGRPVLSYILDDLVAVGVEEVVFIVGYMQDHVRDFVAGAYPGLRPHYVVQEVQDGTAGAVKLAEPYVDDEVFIIFADAVLELDYGLPGRADPGLAGVIWAQEVEDYQRFGVVVTDDDGIMERIVEKPSEPVSRLANIGVYFIRDYGLLFEGINATLEAEPGPSGEFYLTDAFQYMVDQGARILTAPVEGWYDAGKPETLLATNRHLLEGHRGGVDAGARVEGTEIVEPVRIEAGAVVKGGTVGPNVTVEADARVEGSRLSHSIVGEGARVSGCDLQHSLVGARAIVEGLEGGVRIADDSAVVVAAGEVVV